MNIILMTSSLGPGGAERVASTLCNEWIKQGNKVTLIATFSGSGSSFYSLSPLVTVIFLANLVPIKRKSIISYWIRFFTLRKILLLNSFDIVISFLPNVNIAAILATAFTNIPVVISERRDPRSQPTSQFWEVACKALYRFANAVVVQTESVSCGIGDLYSSLKNVTCIPNPLPQQLLQFHRRSHIKNRFVLLSMGRLVPEKQIEHTVYAFSNLASSFKNWDLHIYGDGPSRSVLADLIKNLNLQDRIFLIGRTSSPWNVMEQADAFVMTSRHEGFPNGLLEAMGIGLPCVVYDCPSGPREISSEGLNAILVPLNDKYDLTNSLERLMADSDLRKSLGERARAAVLLRYKSNSILDKWNELFKRLMVK